jgi:hypothetical protein
LKSLRRKVSDAFEKRSRQQIGRSSALDPSSGFSSVRTLLGNQE